MLVRFMVDNYLSFKDQQIFSLAAGKHTRHKSHLHIVNGKRILKGGVIYGANAAGKSNLIKAISFGRSIIIEGVQGGKIKNKHFRIDPNANSKPGVFQYDFVADDSMYSYGFAISYSKSIILAEWLYQNRDNKEICIFDRALGEKTKTDIIFTDELNKQRFDLYSEDVEDDKTFLMEMVSHKVFKIEDFKPFFDVILWFLSLVFVSPKIRGRIGEYMESDELSSAGHLLKYFDTGIETVEGPQKPIEDALDFLPDELKEKVIIDVTNRLSEKNLAVQAIVEVTIQGKRFSFTKENDVIVARQLKMNHGNEDDLFDFYDESDGTQRLFDLIPLYRRGKTNTVIFVDELDRSFHTKLTTEFIRKFYETTEGYPSQLIVTLHDANVMDLNLLRQDEIWFVERQEDHSSKLYSLNKFKERFDHVVSKDYLLGRYGAIPCFDETWNIEEDL